MKPRIIICGWLCPEFFSVRKQSNCLIACTRSSPEICRPICYKHYCVSWYSDCHNKRKAYDKWYYLFHDFDILSAPMGRLPCLPLSVCRDGTALHISPLEAVLSCILLQTGRRRSIIILKLSRGKLWRRAWAPVDAGGKAGRLYGSSQKFCYYFN